MEKRHAKGLILTNKPDRFLDITGEICPLTLVKARLMVDQTPPGSTVEIRLNSGEPLENVPRALAEIGCRILSIAQEDEQIAKGVHILRLVTPG